MAEHRQAEYLLHALDTNPLLKDLYEEPILYMVLNSSMSTNLHTKISNALQQSPVGMQEAMLLYASENKIKAMEDCIEFSGELFRV